MNFSDNIPTAVADNTGGSKSQVKKNCLQFIPTRFRCKLHYIIFARHAIIYRSPCIQYVVLTAHVHIHIIYLQTRSAWNHLAKEIGIQLENEKKFLYIITKQIIFYFICTLPISSDKTRDLILLLCYKNIIFCIIIYE